MSNKGKRIKIAFDDDGSRAMRLAVDLPGGQEGNAVVLAQEPGAAVDPTGAGVGVTSSAALHRYVARARRAAWVSGFSSGFSSSGGYRSGSGGSDIVHCACPGRNAFDAFYEVAASAKFVVEGRFAKVALQMPDYLLPDAPRLVRSLFREIGTFLGGGDGSAPETTPSTRVQIFVLGDTSYGSCCVDEVNASHMGADCCIHYGHACLQPTASLPVQYVFGQLPLHVDACAARLVRHAKDMLKSDDRESEEQGQGGGAGGSGGGSQKKAALARTLNVLVLHDVAYSHHVPSLEAAVQRLLVEDGTFQPRVNIMVARTDMKRAHYPVGSKMVASEAAGGDDGDDGVETSGNANTEGDAGVVLFAGQQVQQSVLMTAAAAAAPGSHDEDTRLMVTRKWVVVFVGSPGTRLTRVAMRYGSACRFAILDPLKLRPSTETNSTTTDVAKGAEDAAVLSDTAAGEPNAVAMLTKRYYLVQRCRDASIIGVVVGTMAVGQYRAALDRVKEVIRRSGRKSYMFLVGKINAAKLLNFPEIDVFVLVACPENSLLDSKTLFKPVVTPFELEMALCEGREWDGLYSADFRDLLEWEQTPSEEGGATSSSSSSSSSSSANNTNTMDGLVRPIRLAEEEDAAEMESGADSQSDEEGDIYMSLLDGKMHSRRGHLFDRKKKDPVGPGGGGESKQPSRLIADKDASRALAVTGNAVTGTSKPTLAQALVAAPATDARDYMLRKREHNGLEVRLGMDKPMAATEGRSGIAWSYQGEGVGDLGGERRSGGGGGSGGVGAGKLQIEDGESGPVTSAKSGVSHAAPGKIQVGEEEGEDASDSSEEEAGPVGGAFGLFDNLTSSSSEDEEDDEEEEGGE